MSEINEVIEIPGSLRLRFDQLSQLGPADGVIDITAVETAVVTERFRNIQIIPIRRGKFKKDFDVAEDLLPADFVWRQKYKGALADRRCGFKPSLRSWLMPLGISIKAIPPGARILLVDRS